MGTLVKPIAELLERIRRVVPAGMEIYLVGGAVRDALLDKVSHDLDFVLPGDAPKIARKVANALGGAYYLLDGERGTGRVILDSPDGSPVTLDFARNRGADLESDLRARDFTINAMAVSLHRLDELIDPLGGARDLVDRELRLCSPTALVDDPLRVLRAYRQRDTLDLKIGDETQKAIQQAAVNLGSVAVERRRDELFKIFEGERPDLSLQALIDLGAGSACFPDAGKGSTSISMDIWNRAVGRVFNFSMLLDSMNEPEVMEKQLSVQLVPPRSLKGLLCLAAFYQGFWDNEGADAGSFAQSSVRRSPRSEWIDKVGRKLALANLEIDWWQKADWGSRWVDGLARFSRSPTRREIYRYFKATGSAGVQGCTLAWTAGRDYQPYGLLWEISGSLLEAWYEKADELVHPPQLLDGNDLQRELGVCPGPLIGRLLDEIGESQAEGLVRSRDQALAHARDWLARHENQGVGEGHASSDQ